MNDKEISQIRRRFKPEKHNITHIRGCYVNEQREIISAFDQAYGLLTEQESELYLSLFRRTLSGGLGKNLIDITFTTKQVADSDEHRLLTALKSSSLKDEEAVTTFYEKVMGNLVLEGNYLILLAHETYDVPFRGKDHINLEDASDTSFSYIVCAICPVKSTKPALLYDGMEKEFHNRATGWVVAPPELGFMFPAFDDRSTNIYNALYYAHNTVESHDDFTDALFQSETPLPATVQKDIFRNILGETLAEECDLKLVQAVHEQLAEKIEEHKNTKEGDLLVVSKSEIQSILKFCGVQESSVKEFDHRFDAEFGSDTVLSPKNIVDTKQLRINTPSVTIQVSTEHSDLIATRMIGGIKYIMISAEEGVEVNGVNIQITE